MLPIGLIGPLVMMGIGFVIIGFPIILYMRLSRGKQKRQEPKPKMDPISKQIEFGASGMACLGLIHGYFAYNSYMNPQDIYSNQYTTIEIMLAVTGFATSFLINKRTAWAILPAGLFAAIFAISPHLYGRPFHPLNFISLIFPLFLSNYMYGLWKRGAFIENQGSDGMSISEE